MFFLVVVALPVQRNLQMVLFTLVLYVHTQGDHQAQARDKKGTVRCFGTKLLLGKRLGLGYVLFTGMVLANTFKRATAPNCGARWLQLGDFYMAQARALQRASRHVPGKGFTVD